MNEAETSFIQDEQVTWDSLPKKDKAPLTQIHVIRHSVTKSDLAGLQPNYSTAMKRQGEAPPFLIKSGSTIIRTRFLEIWSQSTKHLQPAIAFLISAP